MLPAPTIQAIIGHSSSGSAIHYRVQYDDKTFDWIPGTDFHTPEEETLIHHYWRTGGCEYRSHECQTERGNSFVFDLSSENFEQSTRAFVKFRSSALSAIGDGTLPKSRVPVTIVEIDAAASSALVKFGPDFEPETMNLTDLRAMAPTLIGEYYLQLQAL
jgi:hypothetical protein